MLVSTSVQIICQELLDYLSSSALKEGMLIQIKDKQYVVGTMVGNWTFNIKESVETALVSEIKPQPQKYWQQPHGAKQARRNQIKAGKR